jgi:hypothetical protein
MTNCLHGGNRVERNAGYLMVAHAVTKWRLVATPERDDFSSKRHPALAICLRTIFSESRVPSRIASGAGFSESCFSPGFEDGGRAGISPIAPEGFRRARFCDREGPRAQTGFPAALEANGSKGRALRLRERENSGRCSWTLLVLRSSSLLAQWPRAVDCLSRITAEAERTRKIGVPPPRYGSACR